MDELETIDTIDSILSAMARNVRRIPNRVALVHGETSYTWNELNNLTNAGAAELIRRGVSIGTGVGIQMSNGIPGILAIWSILKAGAVYIPLNPVFPETRLEYMRSNADVKITLCDDDIRELISGEPGKLPIITGKDRFAVMYTSGSTGMPKAVNLLHGDAIPYARHYIQEVGLTDTGAVALYAGFSFVLHIADLYAVALSGAALHVLPAEIRLDVHQIKRYFDKHKITAVAFPTGIGRKFLQCVKTQSLSSVTLVGEKLTPFKYINKNLKVFNAYGCTECAGGISIGQIHENEIHVGRIAAGIDASIVDESGIAVTNGAEGELWVHMPGRLHKTGDLAKRDKNGNIEIIGRKDFQLSIRGYRVEPSEIEICALMIPGMAESVAVMRGERLVLYYAFTDNFQAVSKEQIKSLLSEYLPPYMIPSAFMCLDKLPRNPNGKIDRSALPEPLRYKTDGEAPNSETEKQLALIWGKALNLEACRIFQTDSFSELGGDSLNLLVLSVEIKEAFGKTITPAELWEAGTLSQQALLIDSAKEFSLIYAFNAVAGKNPMFFTHSANTGPEVYTKFAEFLPREQPFFAFEHYNLLRSEKLGVRELARIYADEIIRLYPGVPCLLGGWSFGGLIAFEMALIMEREGHNVKHLYLIDPHIGGAAENEAYAGLGTLPYYREYLENEPLFERYRRAGHIERLLDNNAFVLREGSSYVPDGLVCCPTTLFRMTVPDKAYHASDAEQELLAFLWSLRKTDSGFAPFVKKLNIINMAQTHDRVLVDSFSIKIITETISRSLNFSEVLYESAGY